MKKKSVIMCLILAVLAFSGITAAYALWVVETASEDNRIVIGEFAKITVSGYNKEEALLELNGEALELTFTVHISAGNQNAYALRLYGVAYTAVSDGADWDQHIPDNWVWKTAAGDAWSDFDNSGQTLLENAADGNSVTVFLRLKEDLNVEYLNGALTFRVGLE
ncbi:MAG: hypothetical protein LBH24_05705 [Clostridiales bacterium]|nr:hypothetical protein [Clostridiales bacterium]